MATRILTVVGARPNFMKAVPLCDAFSRRPGVESFLVHTGQHYDYEMSQVFFDELELPVPFLHLGVGSGSHGVQTGRTMSAFDAALDRSPADVVLVLGDVNSTLACALVAQKRGIPVAHVEAGLRSFDDRMPEEVNRKITDHLARWLFVTEPAGMENLRREGIAADRCHLVGNVMVETLRRWEAAFLARQEWKRHGVGERGYALVTLHRQENVDDAENLRGVIGILRELAGRLPVLFAIHPRTAKNLDRFGLRAGIESCPGLRLLPPQGYLSFLSLVSRAALVYSDSGGIQTEAWVLGTPCLVARETSEHRSAIESGNSVLVGLDPERVRVHAERALSGGWKSSGRAPGDGEPVGERIARILLGEKG